MSFKCFDCGEIFAETNEMIKHLKQIHKYKEKVDNLRCFVNKSDQCHNVFQTFNSLLKHVRKCSEKNQTSPTISQKLENQTDQPTQNEVNISVENN